MKKKNHLLFVLVTDAAVSPPTPTISTKKNQTPKALKGKEK